MLLRLRKGLLLDADVDTELRGKIKHERKRSEVRKCLSSDVKTSAGWGAELQHSLISIALGWIYGVGSVHFG